MMVLLEPNPKGGRPPLRGEATPGLFFENEILELFKETFNFRKTFIVWKQLYHTNESASTL